MTDVLDEVFYALVTVLVIAALSLTRPTRARCPAGWLHEGVRPSGAFACKPALVGGERDPAGGIDTAYQPPGELGGRVYCTGGAVPIVVDYRTVGCTRRGGS